MIPATCFTSAKIRRALMIIVSKFINSPCDDHDDDDDHHHDQQLL